MLRKLSIQSARLRSHYDQRACEYDGALPPALVTSTPAAGTTIVAAGSKTNGYGVFIRILVKLEMYFKKFEVILASFFG